MPFFSTLGVVVPKRYFWASTLVVFLVGAALYYFRNQMPVGLIAILLGLALGYWLSLIVFTQLSRDLHIAALAGFTGIGADGLVEAVKHLDTTYATITANLLKIAGVLGPAVLSAIKSAGLGTPQADAINAGVVAFLLVFLVRLALTLKDNPPSIETVIAKSDKYSPNERLQLSKAFPPPAPPTTGIIATAPRQP